MSTALSRPLAYGYLRMPAAAQRRELLLWHRQLNTYARGQDFILGQVFVETPTSPEPAFNRLVAQLKQGDATELLVPTLEHFTRFPSLQDGIVLMLGELGVRVWLVGD
ncbi:recombinase family protein [Nocardiopsis sp. FR4]|uniref:recombinase family protein n=1 Tax=Nocardiopsis sp. FR4 TaxID=2605985 RepID=UPI00135708C8|nr:recombinase family protein [Nocardiopsis sp. FR4]